MNVDSINKFVFGVKGLELWNNMACWALSAGQNKDTGITVYALGGLSASNMPHGTMATLGTPPGLPIRTTNGIQFSGIKINNDSWPQNYITTQTFAFKTSSTFFSVINFDFAGLSTDVSSANPVILSVLPTGGDANYQFPRRIALMRTSHTPGNTPITARYGIGTSLYFADGLGRGQRFTFTGPEANSDNNNWAVVGMSYLSGSQLFSRNGSNFVTTNHSPEPVYPIINENYQMIMSSILRPIEGFKGTGAAYFYFNKLLSEQEHAKFYTLYKETLGAGLGLP
jgi:hypothetical protein